MATDWISEAVWDAIVSNVPIVSVDLVVQSPDGIVLGKRANEPAKGEWFVPGSRIHKGERLIDAVDRVAAEEIGVETVEIQESLGAYKHLYETGEADGSGKQYLANEFVVDTDSTVKEMTLDEQHSAVRGFVPAELPADLHEYTAAYLRDAASIPYSRSR